MLAQLVFVFCVHACAKRNAKGNDHGRKAQKRSPQKGKWFSEVPVGDKGSGGSTFTTEAQESIDLKLHGHARLTALYLAGGRDTPSVEFT